MPIISTGSYTINDYSDGYTLTITGGNRAFIYNSLDSSPTPSTPGTFAITLLSGGTSVTPSSYAWSCGGVFSTTATTATFTPTLSGSFNTSSTFVTCTVVYNGISITQTIPISVSRVGTTGTPAVTASISGGNRTFIYDQYGIKPTPATAGTFSIDSVYYGSTLVNTGITYSWSATGIFSGTSSAATFTPTLATSVSPIPASSISCTVTYNGISVVVTESISATQRGPRSPIQAYAEGRAWDDAAATTAILKAVGGTAATFTVNTNATGQISAISATPAAGGSNYAVGDILSIESPGSPTTKVYITVATVNSTGGVLTFTAPTLPAGAGYTISQTNVTATSSAGNSPIFGDRVTTYTEPKWIPIKGSYDSTKIYLKNDIVRHTDNYLYTVIADAAANISPTDATLGSTYWAKYSPNPPAAAGSYTNRGNWSLGTSYAVNDIVNFTKVLSTTSQVLQISEKLSITSANATNDYLVYSNASTQLVAGDTVILSSISASVGLTANTIYYVVSCGGNQLKLSTSSTLTPIVDITGSAVTLTVNRVSISEFVCAIAHTQTTTGTASTDDNYTYLDFVQGASITKTYASGAWTNVAAYFDGNVIVTGTLSVDSLKSGSAVVGNTRGTFALGGDEELFGRRATARFTSDNTRSAALFTVNTRVSDTEWQHSLISGNLSKYGYALLGYNAKNTIGNYRAFLGGPSSGEALVLRRMLEGNAKDTKPLTGENIGTAQSESYFSFEDAAQISRFFVEYTKVFNYLNNSEVVATNGSTAITITNHGLQPNQYIKFDTFTSGTNFVVGKEYWVKTVIDANTITIYPVNSTSSVIPAITVDGTSLGSIRAFVKERPVRQVSLTNGSATITSTGNHNLFPDQLIAFSNLLVGTTFNIDLYRVLAVPSATTFTVYRSSDTVAKTQITFDGTTTTSAIVSALNPERTASVIGMEERAGRFVCYSNNQIYTNSVIDLSTPTNGASITSYVPLGFNPASKVDLANLTTSAGVFQLYNSTGSALTATTQIAAVVNSTTYGVYSDQKIWTTATFAPFTGSHVGVIDSAEPLDFGDIMVDVQVKVKIDISNAILKLSRSSIPMQKGSVGVVSDLETSAPIYILGYEEVEVKDDTPIKVVGSEDIPYKERPSRVEQKPIYGPAYTCLETEKYISINALGEGLINVCGLGGNIETGDLITTSSIAGKGMKQPDDIIRNYTVAKSRETITFDYPEQIKQIACIYLAG